VFLRSSPLAEKKKERGEDDDVVGKGKTVSEKYINSLSKGVR
jgi:hypothetical protein